MQEGYTAVPQWLLILIPIGSLLIGIGSAWAFMRFRIEQNQERIRSLEAESREAFKELSSVKSCVKRNKNDIGWIKQHVGKSNNE